MKHIKIYESFIKGLINYKLNEAFKDSEGNLMNQQAIVRTIYEALVSSGGNYDKFASLMTNSKKVNQGGISMFSPDSSKEQYEKTPITSEETLKELFDTYRPVSVLGPAAFVWMIGSVYDLVNKGDRYSYFYTKIISQLNVQVDLIDNEKNISVCKDLKPGDYRIIDSGPFSYRNTNGFYYNTVDKDSRKPVETDIEIVIQSSWWTLEGKTERGKEILEELLSNPQAFDVYSGWYQNDRFFFALYKLAK